jgi:hypothetical protein
MNIIFIDLLSCLVTNSQGMRQLKNLIKVFLIFTMFLNVDPVSFFCGTIYYIVLDSM